MDKLHAAKGRCVLAQGGEAFGSGMLLCDQLEQQLLVPLIVFKHQPTAADLPLYAPRPCSC